MRTRPSLFFCVTYRTSVIVVNFATTHNSKLLNDGGHKSVLCGNLDCTGGVSGDWETSPLAWQHRTQAPFSFTDSHGATHPVDSMCSRCHTCKYSFLHTNPVTLRRLSTCADLLNQLTSDPLWNNSDNVFVDRSLTAMFE